jgi:hypothetical protein
MTTPELCIIGLLVLCVAAVVVGMAQEVCGGK